MRVPLAAFAIAIVLLLSGTSRPAQAESRPCNTSVLTRQGKHVKIRIAELNKLLNQRLTAIHSHFHDLQLTPAKNGELKVSGVKDGDAVSISGPLRVTDNGIVELHAKQIMKNGTEVDGIMSLFGKSLDDYVKLPRSKTLSVEGDNLRIDVHRLLGLSGRVEKVDLRGPTIDIDFATQPCL